MALLMLSLIKSILVVKLLHHSEKEVRQMSVSACLLDKYGSAGHDFTESALTSTKTLDYINPSGGKLQLRDRFSKSPADRQYPKCVLALCSQNWVAKNRLPGVKGVCLESFNTFI